MSAQLMELLIFAGVAFFIINKLMSSLGNISDDDPIKNKSFFGERPIKDVSENTNKKNNVVKHIFAKTPKIDLNNLIIKSNEKEIKSGLMDVMSKIPHFNVEKFLNNAKSAFDMIINSPKEENALDELIDKRYIESFYEKCPTYGQLTKENNKALEAYISEIYTFGNNIFIKILFSGKNITTKIDNLNEEWTFTKSLLNEGPQWHLTNIDRG